MTSTDRHRLPVSAYVDLPTAITGFQYQPHATVIEFCDPMVIPLTNLVAVFFGLNKFTTFSLSVINYLIMS